MNSNSLEFHYYKSKRGGLVDQNLSFRILVWKIAVKLQLANIFMQSNLQWIYCECMHFIYSAFIPWESTHDHGVASTGYVAKLQETTEIQHAIIEPFFCMLVSNVPAHESILHTNVYQEMLVCDSFCVERMSFTEQRVLVWWIWPVEFMMI